LMNKKGQTPNFTVSRYLAEIQRYVGKDVFDFIVVNNQLPPQELIEVYKEEGELVSNDIGEDKRIVGAPLLSNNLKEIPNGDVLLKRNLIRHDSQRLAATLMNILNSI
jgi:2-phospho-L-lactate transferase/gluconeogenesis factor (CofD/UPF0052 family)